MNFIYIIIIIILDQVTKYIARLKLSIVGDISLIPKCLSFTYVENKGAAFGIFKNKKFLLVGVTGIVTAAMIFYLIKNKNLNKYVKISVSLIIAGAIGNLIDRIYFGFVTDFIHFYIGNVFDWPVFNVADISVVCGTILLAVMLLFQKE